MRRVRVLASLAVISALTCYGSAVAQESALQFYQGKQIRFVTMGSPGGGYDTFHDGRWGQATLEVCLAIYESASTRSEVMLKTNTTTLANRKR